MSNVAGGKASTAKSSAFGSNGSALGSASQPRSSPRPLGRPDGAGLGLVIVDDRPLQLRLHHRVAEPFAFRETGISVGNELRIIRKLGAEAI